MPASLPSPPDADFDLILASASPRRRELLERLGLRVRVEPADVDEAPLPGEAPPAMALRLARAKGAAVMASLAAAPEGTAVLAADTVVVVDRRALGKPTDEAEARAMLATLLGRRHEVITAFCVGVGERALERTVSTQVSMRAAHAAEVEAYLASGEWRGKAGAYAIQGIASVFVTEIRGSYTNVVGLPLAEVVADLRALGALSRYPRPAFGTGR